MWPFKKKQSADNLDISAAGYSQTDFTDKIGGPDIGKEEWITVTPISAYVKNPEAMGLPPADASDEEIHKISTRLSMARDRADIASDGVYCPVCNIANIDLTKLHLPCPKCKRPLLRFGWD